MKYKALISDVDGTLVPNNAHGRPSQKVKDTISKAQKHIHIGVATARPYRMMKEIAETLQLSGPSIIHGGAQIMDLNTGKIYRRHVFLQKDIQKIFEITKRHHQELLIDDEYTSFVPENEYTFETPILGSYISGISMKEADALLEDFSQIPTIVAYKIPSWEKGKIDVSIGPSQATKQHGVLEVAEILGISTDEIIGIGDGYNDFPLLMACGLKIAIGNAVPELKEIADFVAPSVEEDGLADVIEKFVLNT